MNLYKREINEINLKAKISEIYLKARIHKRKNKNLKEK